MVWKKELPWQSSLKPDLPFWHCRVNNLLKTKPIAPLPKVIFLWLGLREHIAPFVKFFNSVATCTKKNIYLNHDGSMGETFLQSVTIAPWVTCAHAPVRVKWDKRSRGQTPKPHKPNFSRCEDHQAALVTGNKQKSKELLVPQFCSPKGWNKNTTYPPLRRTNEDYSLVHCYVNLSVKC